ncbi:ubiquitin-associated protein-like lingerer isoform X1 [Leptinotarsa decemlineata]|uniref:ubiquitin-associated protein-like lingerer isoform X1 n=1 Tax=Leptinotarsa decemlineata TaxID=7539 RepID=UPI003D306E99
MSSSNRAASKGGKGAKADKSHKSEKSESGKGNEKHQHREVNSKNEDPSMKEKVKTLIEMTQRSEEEVCWALHECNNDLNEAIEMIFESMGIGEWETRVKKKKTRQASASKQEKSEENAPADGWDENTSPGVQQGEGKEKPRNRSGPPPRLHRNNDNRGWRGRERQENDRNLEDSGRPDYHRDRDRRGRPGGPRGGGGGRGRGGGRAGGRYPPRGNRSNSYNKPIETWDNSNSNTWDNSTALTATNHNTEETWDEFPGTDEWSTEEYQGSLADTKVFTPSVQPTLDPVTEPPGNQALQDSSLSSQQLGQTLQMGQSMQMPSQSPVPPLVGTLTAAQTQYFTQLQQNNDNLSKQYASPGQTTYEKSTSVQYNNATTIPYNSGAGTQYNANVSQYNNISTSQYSSTTTPPYSGTQQYGSQGSNYVDTGYQNVNAGYGVQESVPTQQPPRAKTQRARVPPPSKIPASAVEMPGDLNSSIGYLDVQFGAMDLIDSNSSFDGNMDTKYSVGSQLTSLDINSVTTASPLELNSANQNSNLDGYSPKNNAQSSISSVLSQSLSNSDSIPQTSEHLASSTYSSAPRSTAQGAGTSTAGVATASAGGLELSKQPDSHSYSQPSTYNSFPSKANTYNTSSYTGTTTTASSYSSNQANSYVNVNSQSGGGYNAPSGNVYPNTYSSNSSYQSTTNSATFPSISQANTFSSNNQTYPQNTSQSVYGANTGLSNSTYGNTSTSQYNNYSSSNKIVKDSSYESSSNTTSVSQTATTNVTSSAPISMSQTTMSVSKTSTTLAAKNSNSVVSNIPPGVTPVMSTPYIMGQVPYFQQPMYSYEDMQLLQQRLPHMTTPYYDMSYQTPTTLAQVRDATLGNVGYSLSDGRFTRTDNNASPVPSTLSQQTSTLTQGHQAQPILAGTGPPYFFATAFNTIAPNYQFGTMYTQLPAATNAHGSNNNNQYPKPATYGSGYGSYDALNQSQDYTKGAYVGNTQAQKASGANASSTGSAGNDLSAMYAKSHTALGKVNSYEKQGFHSGTPPPFTGALHGSQNAGLAPSGTGYPPQVYIPTMAPHQQHHSTHLMQPPLHQMDVRHQGRRVDSGTTGGQRSQTSNQAKSGAKQSYQTSYWNQA